MKKTLYLALLLSCAITYAGCNGNPSQEVPDAELMGTLWTLESIEVPGEPDILVGSTVTVNIQFYDDNLFGGKSFCNGYYGTYTLSLDSDIELDSLITTFIYCEIVDKEEEEYYEALGLVHSYNISGNILGLRFNNDSMLKYQYLE